HQRRVVTEASRADTEAGLAEAVASRSCNTRARAFSRASVWWSSDVTMSIVSTDQVPGHAPGPLLEVLVLHPRDVPGAHDGGADRLFLVDDPTSGGLCVEPAVVSAVCRETDLPVRVMLRLNDTYTTTGGELTRLVGPGDDYL